MMLGIILNSMELLVFRTMCTPQNKAYARKISIPNISPIKVV